MLEGKFQGMDVTKCYGKYAKDADLEDKSKSLIASLNWFIANANDVLTGGFDYVIADEIHLADEAFRKETMISLLRIIEKFNTKSGTKLILMTGTPSIEVNYLDKDKTCFVKVGDRARFRVRYAVLLPHAPCLRVVVEMAVFMIEHISSVYAEIEITGSKCMREFKSQIGFTQCIQTPFRLVMRIDIKNGFLAVVKMVSEVKERIRVSQSAPYVAVVFASAFETRRL